MAAADQRYVYPAEHRLYVSPVIAAMLGWAILDEKLTLQMIGAIVIILSGVVFIMLAAEKRDSRPSAPEHAVKSSREA